MREIPYKAVGDRRLLLHVVAPRQGTGDLAAAAVFFHGGGWVKGSWEQFRPQAARLCALGMVAILVEYRREGPVVAAEDAVDAMNAVFDTAPDLGVDASRIVAAGGSAGGQLALATAVLDLPNSDPRHRPAALVLLNPVTDTTGDFPAGFGRRRFDGADQARRYSPLHQVTSAVAPMVIMHGTADAAVAHENSAAFAAAVNRLGGGPAELISYPGQPHGFFNPRSSGLVRPGVDGDANFELTMQEIARFLGRTVPSSGPEANLPRTP